MARRCTSSTNKKEIYRDAPIFEAMRWIAFCLTLLMFTNCNERPDAGQQVSADGTTARFLTAPAGAVIAVDSMRTREELNETYFKVAIVGSDHSSKGTYGIHVWYGHNDAITQITFPQDGTQMIRPAIRKGEKPSTYVVGFYYGNEDTFYDYLLIEADKGQTSMKYLKAYSFR